MLIFLTQELHAKQLHANCKLFSLFSVCICETVLTNPTKTERNISHQLCSEFSCEFHDQRRAEEAVCVLSKYGYKMDALEKCGKN